MENEKMELATTQERKTVWTVVKDWYGRNRKKIKIGAGIGAGAGIALFLANLAKSKDDSGYYDGTYDTEEEEILEVTDN